MAAMKTPTESVSKVVVARAKRLAQVGVLAMLAVWDLDSLFADLPKLRTPFLFLAGEGDSAIPLAQQREVAARTPGARLIVVSRTGHLLHEEQPAAVAQLILAEIENTKSRGLAGA